MLMAVLFSSGAFANFVSAKVKVTGVTCSMCSNSVHQALSTLSFIDKIDVDLQKAEYNLTFKAGAKVSMDAIKDKIEGAGFSVGLLMANFKFSNVSVTNDYHYIFGDDTYHFVNVKNQNLNGVTTIRFVDKGLAPIKEHKKYIGLTGHGCIKTGGSKSNRIYRVTI
ncbi:MAG: hypothetical protein K0S53_2631 [Bacteroidetes bacterium]|nr:hypothetical protein [Bacteroidota bacterium]